MEKNNPETYDKYIKAITDISRAITSDQYLEDILKLIVMVTAKVTGVEICSLWLIDESESPKKIRLKATQAIAPDYLKDRSLALDEGVVGFVATHNQPLIIRDVSTEPRFKEKEMAKKLGLVSMVSVPLQVKDEKVIGVQSGCSTVLQQNLMNFQTQKFTSLQQLQIRRQSRSSTQSSWLKPR
jgi:signal transduction protein with GAF and PtsI domain